MAGRAVIWRVVLALGGHPPFGRSHRRSRLVPVTSRTHWLAMTQNVRNAATWQIPVLLLGVVLLLAGCGGDTAIGEAKAKTSTAPTSTTTSEAAVETTEAPPTTEAPLAGPGDFGLSVKLLSQECFGSAGCNITYRVQVDHGPTNGSYEVSYEVAVPGDENSPYQGTLTVTDGQYEEPFQDMASPSRRIKNVSAIKVKVTAVEAR
jgi:hypothetical protein